MPSQRKTVQKMLKKQSLRKMLGHKFQMTIDTGATINVIDRKNIPEAGKRDIEKY